MATILDKDLIRETIKESDGRKIILTLTKDQRISMKLKGMKSGAVSIGIDELYAQLSGNPIEEVGKEDKKQTSINIDTSAPKSGTKGNPMISLYDLRSQNAISGLDLPTLVKFDGLIKNLIDLMK